MSRARSLARTRALQALYQWQLTAKDLGLIDEEFLADQDMTKVDIEYFQRLLHQIPAQTKTLDAHIAGLLDRAVEQLDPVEHAILWIGTYELAECPEVPYRVVINEAVELAKNFGAEASHRYVNGVLDKVARTLREPEVKARGGR